MGKLRIFRASVYIHDKVKNTYNSLINKSKIINSEIDYFDIDFNCSELLDIENRNHLKLIENGYKYIFPLIYSDNLIGFICLGQKIQQTDELSGDEAKYAKLICQISSGALINAKNFKSLNENKNQS